jgi:hypothetical protein
VSNFYASAPPAIKQLNQEEMTALQDVKRFSILAIVGFLLGTVGLAIEVYFLLTDLSKGIYSSQPLTSSLSSTYYVLPASVPAIIIEIVSLVFLRSAYRHLKSISERFNSAYTGINLYFTALVLIIAGVILIIGLSLSNSILLILGGAVIILVGGIMGLVGEILGLVVGAFRLRDYFNKSSFGTAGIMYVVGIFIPFFSLIGAIFFYMGANSILTEKRITQT